MKYPKHFVVIRDKKFDIGQNYTIDEDLDIPYMKMNFDFPYYETGEWTTKQFRKYDRVQMYFDFFDSPGELARANIDSMPKIFDGYINRMELSEDKSGGSNYKMYTRSTIGLSYERTIEIPSFSGDINTIMQRSLQQTDILAYIPNIYVKGISDTMTLKVEGNKYFGKVLDQLREKYAIQTFQVGSGDLYIQTPAYLTGQTVEASVYDLKTNVFNMNYGEITQDVDTVVVVGNNCIGIAFDPIGFQLKKGVALENIQTTISPDSTDLNALFIYRRDLYSQQECQEVAINKLIELARNYQISFDTVFEPTRKVGDMFLINNSDRISSTQKWIMKKRTTVIGKDNVKSTISGYSNSITDFPDDILLSSTGILDTDILEVTEKVANLVSLH